MDLLVKARIWGVIGNGILTIQVCQYQIPLIKTSLVWIGTGLGAEYLAITEPI